MKERKKIRRPRVSSATKRAELKSGETKIGKGMELPRGKASQLRKKPGMGSVGRWKNVSKKNFAGPKGTFPVFDLAHGRNALARAHFASNPEAIKRKVYAKFPQLKKKKKK